LTLLLLSSESHESSLEELDRWSRTWLSLLESLLLELLLPSWPERSLRPLTTLPKGPASAEPAPSNDPTPITNATASHR